MFERGFVELPAFEELLTEQPSLFPKVLEILAGEVGAARRALKGILHELATRPTFSPSNSPSYLWKQPKLTIH